MEKTADAVAAQLPTKVGEYSRNVIEDAIGDRVSVRRSRRGDPYPIAAEWLARLRTTELALGQGARWNTLLLELAPETDAVPPELVATPTKRKPLIFKGD